MALEDIINNLRDDANRFIKVELLRLGQEVKFIDDINTSLDFMVGSVVDGMMTRMDPAITSNTNLPEDNAVIRSVVVNAMYKAIDNKIITGMSDMVNRSPGDMFAAVTGDSQLAALVSSIANRTNDRVSSNQGNVGQGNFGEAIDVSESIADVVNRLYAKIFSVISMALSNAPSMIGGLATSALQSFISESAGVTSDIDRFDELAQVVADNCSAIDGTYYAIDHFEQVRLAQDHLLDADTKLVNVRSSLIASGALNEYRYGLARDDVQLAADDLENNGNTTNRIQETYGALDELDSLLSKIEDGYGQLSDRKDSLDNYMGDFDDGFDSNSTTLGIITNVQVEIRSIMNSMDAAIAKGHAAVVMEQKRRWWMQLLVLIEKMAILPSSVSDYVAADPDGYVTDYNTDVGTPMQSVSFPDVDLLRSQLGQLKYWVGRKFNTDIPVTQILDIVSQMSSDNADRKTAIGTASSIASNFNVPLDNIAAQIPALLSDVGMDRASDIFDAGKWADFFSLNPQNATYLGQLEQSVASAVSELSGAEGATIDGLAAMNEVLVFVRDQKRSRDALAATFSAFKDLGLQFKVSKEIPEVQGIYSLIDRFITEVS